MRRACYLSKLLKVRSTMSTYTICLLQYYSFLTFLTSAVLVDDKYQLTPCFCFAEYPYSLHIIISLFDASTESVN